MIELTKAGINFRQEVEKTIVYDGKTIYKRRLDLLVEDEVLLELKAQKEVDNGDMVQVLNYLKVFNLETGLILNFQVCFSKDISTLKSINP